MGTDSDPDSAPDSVSLSTLARGSWFEVVAAQLRLPRAHRAAASDEARDLAAVAIRVLNLDAEDFQTAADRWSKRSWAGDLAACGFPASATSRRRGALGSLEPLYALLLEVVQLRWQRREPGQLLVVAHLIGEYLCQLAWEPVLGHAGDPVKMVTSTGELFGADDPACPMPSVMKATARRCLKAADGKDSDFTEYLERFHSRLGDSLAVCGTNTETIAPGERPDEGLSCTTPCRWALRPPLIERQRLDARLRLALGYLDSPLVALRHHAPVGHFFDEPSLDELRTAWMASWRRLARPWNDQANPLPAQPDPDDGALPGLAQFVSVVAGRSITGGDLLKRIGDDLATALDRDR